MTSRPTRLAAWAALAAFLGGCSTATIDPVSEPEPGTEIPADVTAALERRRACEHFLGEEPYDAERRRFLELRIRQTCSGINEQIAATRALHRDDPRILDLFADFEDVEWIDETP